MSAKAKYDYHQPLPDAESHFLRGGREHEDELATAGRVIGQGVQAFDQRVPASESRARFGVSISPP